MTAEQRQEWEKGWAKFGESIDAYVERRLTPERLDAIWNRLSGPATSRASE